MSSKLLPPRAGDLRAVVARLHKRQTAEAGRPPADQARGRATSGAEPGGGHQGQGLAEGKGPPAEGEGPQRRPGRRAPDRDGRGEPERHPVLPAGRQGRRPELADSGRRPEDGADARCRGWQPARLVYPFTYYSTHRL